MANKSHSNLLSTSQFYGLPSLLSGSPSKDEISWLAKKEIEKNLLKNERNSLEYYDNSGEHLIFQSFPSLRNKYNFRSLHKLADTRFTRKMKEKYADLSLSREQEIALKDIQKISGKPFLISQVYTLYYLFIR